MNRTIREQLEEEHRVVLSDEVYERALLNAEEGSLALTQVSYSSPLWCIN